MTKIVKDLETHVIPALHARGAKTIGALGLCAGSAISMHLATTDLITATASCHPSHGRMAPVYGIASDKLIAAVKVPVLQYTAGNDQPEQKPGGIEEKTLAAKPFGSKNDFKEFPDVVHGWLSRHPITNAAELRDYRLALDGVITFFKANV